MIGFINSQKVKNKGGSMTKHIRFICMILKFRYESVRIVIIQTCAFEELRIQILSADYQFGVILALNNLYDPT